MRTVTVEIYNDNALHLIEDLERLDMVKIVKTEKNNQVDKERMKTRESILEDLWGSISKEDGDKLLKEIEKSRNEWERVIW